jgi:hypothetical protein
MNTRILRWAIAALVVLSFALSSAAQGFPQKGIASGASAKNVRVVGYNNLNGRPAFKLAIQEAGGRWYLYMGHLWDRGWSIMDVTDPTKPQIVKFIPGPTNTWTIQMEVDQGKMITALEQIPAGWGGVIGAPNDEGVLIWDVATDPVNPRLLGQFKTGGTGTHRDFYAGGPYVHLAAGMPGYVGNIYVIIDISDPAHPTEVGRWWVPGQYVAGGEKPTPTVSLHGPPYVEGNLAYLSYGSAGMVILDISNVRNPTLVSQFSFSPPFVSLFGVHSVVPMTTRKLAITNSEAIAEECKEALNEAAIVDISNVKSPTLLSVLPVPVPPPGLPYDNFCQRGGRFGPHNQNHHRHSEFTQHSDNLVYLTYFNAGLRILDISDPRLPHEVGYFLPPNPTQRYGPYPVDKLVSQTEDVLVDARGYIYITDKNEGIWILQYMGNEEP